VLASKGINKNREKKNKENKNKMFKVFLRYNPEDRWAARRAESK
jgi:hypothetical protein